MLDIIASYHFIQGLGCQIIFFKNLTRSVTKHHGELSSCTILAKNNDPILRKRSDGRTDGQTDESDFIGRVFILFGRASKNQIYLIQSLQTF